MILITGASRGIGRFLLEKSISDGKRVMGTFNNTTPDSKFLNYMKKVDIRNCDEIKDWLSKIEETDDKLILLNCAGNNYNAVAHKADIVKWSDVVNVNLVGSFNVILNILPLMRNKNYGRIINFSSVVAQIGIPGTSAYAASKAGLWGLARAIAIENAKKGITINTLNLGYFNIGMIAEVPEDFQSIIKNRIPTGQFGNPEEIWKTVNYIIDNGYINGTSIDINGALF